MSGATQTPRQSERGPFVVGPHGTPLHLSDLPPTNCTRWVGRRKAEVVAAVRGGLLGLNEVLKRYGLTAAEYENWEDMFDRHGLLGLRTTRVQAYRSR
jgi:hypothetical protein